MSISPFELGHAVKRLQHRHHRTMDTRLAPLGISLVQWNALREIDRHPGAPQHRLAELTFNSDQAFGTLAKRLRAQGFVKSRAGAGRAILLELTTKGRALLAQGQKVAREMLDESFAPLDEKERVTLRRLLDKVLGG